jgi:hypothetical protein
MNAVARAGGDPKRVGKPRPASSKAKPRNGRFNAHGRGAKVVRTLPSRLATSDVNTEPAGSRSSSLRSVPPPPPPPAIQLERQHIDRRPGKMPHHAVARGALSHISSAKSDRTSQSGTNRPAFAGAHRLRTLPGKRTFNRIRLKIARELASMDTKPLWQKWSCSKPP